MCSKICYYVHVLPIQNILKEEIIKEVTKCLETHDNGSATHEITQGSYNLVLSSKCIHFFIKKKKRERETENEFVRCSTHGTLKSWQSKTKGWWKLILKIIGKINSTGTKETMEHKQNPELNLHGEDGKSS